MALEADRYGSRADTFLFLVCVALSLVAMALPATWRDPMAGMLRRSVLAPLLALQEQSTQFQLSRAQFVELERQRDSAALAATFLPALRAENERLRGLLGLGERLGGGYVPAEVLHQAEPTSPLELVIRAGRRQGVRRLAPVVSPDGLLGTVSAVEPRTSTVVTWAHPDFRASAMAADGSVYGIVASAGGSGPGGTWLLELRGVPYRQRVAQGTVIVTAGLGGVIPRGIPLGVVMDTAAVESGWERTYLVRPLAQPAGVGHVVVLVIPAEADASPAFAPRDAGP
jgi:rod shape-determining protein MreC